MCREPVEMLTKRRAFASSSWRGNNHPLIRSWRLIGVAELRLTPSICVLLPIINEGYHPLSIEVFENPPDCTRVRHSEIISHQPIMDGLCREVSDHLGRSTNNRLSMFALTLPHSHQPKHTSASLCECRSEQPQGFPSLPDAPIERQSHWRLEFLAISESCSP